MLLDQRKIEFALTQVDRTNIWLLELESDYTVLSSYNLIYDEKMLIIVGGIFQIWLNSKFQKLTLYTGEMFICILKLLLRTYNFMQDVIMIWTRLLISIA